LRDSAAWLAAEDGDELAGMLLRLRLWAVYYLNELADSLARDELGDSPARGRRLRQVSRWQR
jgi:hypothetical protein